MDRKHVRGDGEKRKESRDGDEKNGGMKKKEKTEVMQKKRKKRSEGDKSPRHTDL